MYEAGPIFSGMQQSSFRAAEDVSHVIAELWCKKLPNSKLLHLFGAKAAPSATLADTHAALFRDGHLSQALMAISLSRLCTQDGKTHFVHPGVWDKANTTLRFTSLQGAIDASGFLATFPIDTKRVFFPFMVGQAWVLCVFMKEDPCLLLVLPNSVRLPSNAIPFLKGVMSVLLGCRKLAASTTIRSFSIPTSDFDSGYLSLSICHHLQVCEARDLSLWSTQDPLKARICFVSGLVGFNP